MRALIRNAVLPAHRWTALTVGLVVLWMALTGLGLLFKAQLDPAVNRRLESSASSSICTGSSFCRPPTML